MGGGKGGGGGSQTVTQKADPWSGIQPQLLQAAGDTQHLYDTGMLKPQVFQGQTFANFSPETTQAMGLTANRAINGSPVNAANKGMLTDTINGKYLDPAQNPYLKSTYDQASNSVRGSVDSQFGAGGRYGGGLNQDVLGEKLGDLANNIYGANYQQERSRQLAASALAPQAANQDYTDLGALANVGAQKEGMTQNSINDQINRFNANAAAPGQNVQNYIGLLNGAGGQYGATTQTSPYQQNNTLGGLGQGLGLLGNIGGLGSGLSSLGSLAGSAAMGAGEMGPAAMGMQGLKAFMSDSRLKEDIRLVGSENGFPIYNFRYRGEDKTMYRGVMAQDVIRTHPEAIEVRDGYMAVDYGMIGVRFERLN